MSGTTLGGETLFRLGPLGFTDTLLTSLGISFGLALLAVLVSRFLLRLSPRWQAAVESAVLTLEGAVAEVVPHHARRIMPFIATLWLFVLSANLAGLIPGLHSPTRDLSATAALALLVFCATHWYGIHLKGWRNHLRHYIEPSVILLPFHIVSEFTRTLALAIRLFGNMMSLEMAAVLILLIAGFLVPVPILMLHVIEAVIQAYIFGMLALIYIAGALEAPDDTSPDSTEKETAP